MTFANELTVGGGEQLLSLRDTYVLEIAWLAPERRRGSYVTSEAHRARAALAAAAVVAVYSCVPDAACRQLD